MERIKEAFEGVKTRVEGIKPIREIQEKRKKNLERREDDFRMDLAKRCGYIKTQVLSLGERVVQLEEDIPTLPSLLKEAIGKRIDIKTIGSHFGFSEKDIKKMMGDNQQER